jgi:hypothetical protein
VKDDGGLVLTLNSIVSPARTLVREQNPSIHGERHFATARVFVRIQSVVPGRSFSERTEAREGEAQPASAAAAAPFRRSRRVII